MKHSAIKLLLAANLIFLGMLLVRETALADSGNSVAQAGQPQMVVADGMVYVLDGKELQAYLVNNPMVEGFLGDIAKQIKLVKVSEVSLDAPIDSSVAKPRE